jgi:hypothetical protein
MKLLNPCQREGEDACADLPDLRRLHYFHGQMLGVNDFRTEQAFFREKLKLHNRCLHGWGTVCGLMVKAVQPPRECRDDNDEERRKLEEELRAVEHELEAERRKNDQAAVAQLEKQAEEVRLRLDKLPATQCDPPTPVRVVVECGLALDCHGNEILVPRDYAFEPWHLLSERDRKIVREGRGKDLYLSICYCEQPIDPVRPVLASACGGTPECTHGKVRDSFSLRLTTEAPPPDDTCETCCGSCRHDCVLLAVLRGFSATAGTQVIDNSIRRLVSTYPATTITGISFTQGATYSIDEASQILGSRDGQPGIQVNFSRPILTSTLVPGVVRLWVVEGGRTRGAGIYALEGKFEDFGGAEAVTSFRFTYQGDEGLDPGDQLMLTILGPHILDKCCRPVDGANVGGRVPLLAGFERFDRAQSHSHCATRPPGYGPWTSGGNPPGNPAGSNFEAWFFVRPAEDGKKSRIQEYRK